MSVVQTVRTLSGRQRTVLELLEALERDVKLEGVCEARGVVEDLNVRDADERHVT
jgi:hypothetical protein